ncbi:SIS domain-containing protein [Microbacterium paludicola]|uniref:SIS domain-containing protein n=1 Tax=Microbacterium paludicola TaxID=300019 RepID=A0A4Y9FYN3_9MICO|nr:SIS domain-containing protein [Microbacterium paludicola]MBF0815952.1 SIS domain-containing protein [Microbacterium paludicola]TFU33420.1 SIS domain-containing protein [Microbacterium paludicola]
MNDALSAGSAAPASGLFETLTATMPDLRASERKVADVVLADPAEAVEFNMAGLADAAGVSEPTVMRFCAALGFDGFRSFKLALAQSVAVGLPLTYSAISRSDSLDALAEKVFNHTISSLDRARRHLDTKRIGLAVDLLVKADDLIFVGFGASGIVAQDAQQKFPLFGVPCQAPSDFHQQFIAASMSRPTTVTVAISHTARTREVVRVAEAARAAGGRVVAITGDEGPLSSLAHVEIRSSTFEDTDVYTPSVSRLADLVIVDILATAVATRRSVADLERVQEMKQSLARMRGSEESAASRPGAAP